MTSDDEAEVNRAEVERTILEYARAADRGDGERVRGLFTADAVVTIGERAITGSKLDRFFGLNTSPVDGDKTKYVITNILVDGTDGSLRATSYFQMLGTEGLRSWGRYHDEFACVAGRWRIRSREVCVDGRAAARRE